MPTVRPMSPREAEGVRIVGKVLTLQIRSTLPVNWLVCQNAVISSTTSAARYSSTNQASPGVSSRVARAHGRRQSAAETRSQNPCAAGAGTAALVTAIGRGFRAGPQDRSFDLGVPRRHPLRVRQSVV